MTIPALLLYFEDEHESALQLASAAGLALAQIERHSFPDGEIKLRLPVALPESVVILRTLDHPNEKLLELLLAARTARELGARQAGGGEHLRIGIGLGDRGHAERGRAA